MELFEKLTEEVNGTDITFGKKYGHSWNGNRFSILSIYNNLFDGERVEKLTVDQAAFRTKCIGLTNKRIISFQKMGFSQFEVRWEDVRSVTPGGLFSSGKISTIHNDEILKIEWDLLEASISEEFYRYVQERINDFRQKTSNNTQSEISITDELRKYSKLKDDGIITEEEFILKKKQLLNL